MPFIPSPRAKFPPHPMRNPMYDFKVGIETHCYSCYCTYLLAIDPHSTLHAAVMLAKFSVHHTKALSLMVIDTITGRHDRSL